MCQAAFTFELRLCGETLKPLPYEYVVESDCPVALQDELQCLEFNQFLISVQLLVESLQISLVGVLRCVLHLQLLYLSLLGFYFMAIVVRTALLFVLLAAVAQSSPVDELTARVVALKEERQLRGVQLQLSQGGEVVFNLNLGEKNQALDPIDNNTIFRIASISKSFSSVALMQLVEQGKLSLTQSLSTIFGYTIQNPHFPGEPITIEMLLSHQSSLVECEPYYTNFLLATSRAQSGLEVPNIKEILTPLGRFYNPCLFSASHRPGSYFDYVNLNFGIAGTIVQILSQQRFDRYVSDHILTQISEGLAEVATFYPFTIRDARNLGVIYEGEDGKWVPSCDNYPNGKIPERNLTGYVVGSNGVVFGPQGSLRASAAHLTNYALMLAGGGKTKSGKVILSPSSVEQITRTRYLYRGKEGGEELDFHNYGFGLFRTTYRVTDSIVPHQTVIGHIGDAYGLLSGLHFWGKYTLTYIISGALHGYRTDTATIYEYERMAIHSAASAFFQASSRASTWLLI